MDRLSLYNDALLLCGELFLESLTEERETRRLLDQVWNSGGVRTCLEAGQWNFAMRTVRLDYDSGIQPDFGYRRAFDKPSDWVNTSGLCADEFFRVPLLRYIDESNYWYSDMDTIYVRYVSDDIGYGGNMSAWPGSFRDYIAEFFASRIIRKLANSEQEEASSLKRLEKKLIHAKSRSAMAEPTSFPARGNWSNARNRFGTRNRDDKIGGSLIG